MNDDELIARGRERIADLARRVDVRATAFHASVSSMGLGDLLSIVRSVSGDLQRLLSGGDAADVHAKATAFERQMREPATRALPAPVAVDVLADTEQAMGVTLPHLLRRLYLEVANGGFGPGYGILGVRGGWTTDRGRTIEDLYGEMADSTTEDARWVWPSGLVPLVDHSGAFSCIDTTTTDGRIVGWDPDELDGRGRDGGWGRSFSEEAPSLRSWLEEWLGRPTIEDRMSAQLAELRSTVPEETRAHWAAMSQEQRAALGLPRYGWGRALFGDKWGDDPRDQE